MSTEEATETTHQRFSQQRKNDQQLFSEQAKQLLMDYFGCSESSVHSVETALDAEYTTVEEGAIIQALDYHCVDLMIEKPGRLVALAQRFRPLTAKSDDSPDFSIRYDTGTTYKAEHELLSQSIANGGIMPSYYSFGIHNNNVLIDWYLVNVRELYTHVIDASIEYDGPHYSPGGTKAIYFDLDEMDDVGCIERHYDTVDIEEVVEVNEE